MRCVGGSSVIYKAVCPLGMFHTVGSRPTFLLINIQEFVSPKIRTINVIFYVQCV